MLVPFEPIELKAIQGRHNYLGMSSNEVMQDMKDSKVATKNALDKRVMAKGMKQGPSFDLKAKLVHLDDSVEVEACPRNILPVDLEKALHDHLSLASRAFWRDPAKAKAQINQGTIQLGRKSLLSRQRLASTVMTSIISSKTVLMRIENIMVEGLFQRTTQS